MRTRPPHSIGWPLTPRQVENVNSMFEELYRNSARDTQAIIDAIEDAIADGDLGAPGGTGSDQEILYNAAGVIESDAYFKRDYDTGQIYVGDPASTAMITINPTNANYQDIMFGGTIDSSQNYIPVSDNFGYLWNQPSNERLGVELVYAETPGVAASFSRGVGYQIATPDSSNDPRAFYVYQYGGLGTGADGTGMGFLADRNSEGNGAAAWLGLYDKGGTVYYMWPDDNGTFRFHTARPTESGSVSDTVTPAASLAATNITLDQRVTANSSTQVVAAAGSSHWHTLNYIFSGDAGGTTDANSLQVRSIARGSNNIAGIYGSQYEARNQMTSGTLTTAIGHNVATNNQDAGATTNMIGVQVTPTVSGAGNITGQMSYFRAVGGTFSSTGDITGAIYGMRMFNIGRSTATTVIGLDVNNQTKGSGDAYAVRLSNAAASGKWNVYADGTAINYFRGEVGIGAAPAATGGLRMSNDSYVVFRNAANTDDIEAFTVTPSNNMLVGPNTATDLAFQTNDTVRWRVLSTGHFVAENGTEMLKWGSTTSFPALKRSTTQLQVRLGDDSNYTSLRASNYGAGANGDSTHLFYGSGTSPYFKLENTATTQFSNTGFKLVNTEVSSGHEEFLFFAEKGSAGAATGGTNFQIRRRNSAQTEATTHMVVDTSGNVCFNAGFTAGSGSSLQGNVGIKTSTMDTALCLTAAGGLSWVGRSRIYSPSSGVITLYNTGETDFGRVQLGGTSSSFPAIKRSSATVQFRLADDSNYAGIRALHLGLGADGTTTNLVNIDGGADTAPRVKVAHTTTTQFGTSGFIFSNTETASGHEEWHFTAQKNSSGSATGASQFIFRRRNSSQSEATTHMQIDGSGHVTFNEGFTAGSGASLQGNVGIQQASPEVTLTLINTGTFGWGGRSRLKSSGSGLLTLLNNTETGWERLMFGGTSSSFPALKRSNTQLQVVLADDSAFTSVAAQYLDITDGITAPSAATGRARIYVDTSDGDLKVIFADGTIKTIVTDT